MTAVLTAAQHRDIPGSCICRWGWPGPGSPWVRLDTAGRCPAHPGEKPDKAAGYAALRRFWELRAEAARRHMAAAEQDLARARKELAALGAVVVP